MALIFVLNFLILFFLLLQDKKRYLAKYSDKCELQDFSSYEWFECFLAALLFPLGWYIFIGEYLPKAFDSIMKFLVKKRSFVSIKEKENE